MSLVSWIRAPRDAVSRRQCEITLKSRNTDRETKSTRLSFAAAAIALLGSATNATAARAADPAAGVVTDAAAAAGGELSRTVASDVGCYYSTFIGASIYAFP